MRSLFNFAPWVRHIYLVTDDQVPAWLDTTSPHVTVVSHREIFGDAGQLPTFNSHAIETRLHHIPGLSEHFLYFNDDVMLGRPLVPQTFFQGNGLSKMFPSRAKVDPAQIDISADIPSTAAGKNNRRLISDAFDRQLTFKMKHVPHALRRDVLLELEGRYPAEITATAQHQFRHPGDVSLTSSLYQYYAYLTNRAAIDNIIYMYVDLAAPDTPGLLRLALAKRNYDVYCLNDTDSTPEEMARQSKVLHEFLSAYYPVPAPWELPDGDAR
ncbi:stealth conserved region 3 domain-containing protein [Luedemannella flava]